MRCEMSNTQPDILRSWTPFTRASLQSPTVVLLGDNDREHLLVSRRILEQCGCVVLMAEGPNRAIELFAEYGELIDILIADVNMHEAFEYELAESLRQWLPRLPVLFMSAASDTEKFQRRFRFIEKPFTVGRFIESVAAALHAPELIRRSHFQRAS